MLEKHALEIGAQEESRAAQPGLAPNGSRNPLHEDLPTVCKDLTTSIQFHYPDFPTLHDL
jgi:hypothetical protein